MTRSGPARAAIVGLSGPALTAAEAALFRAAPPLGAILFARNIQDPTQLAGLVAALREELGEDAPLLVDQEGGRVARLRPPHWPAFPAAAAFEGRPDEAARANAALLGHACREAGFNTVCAPVLDLRVPGAHDIVGDRALGADPAEVARLGRAWVEGLWEAGCVPVVKHVPGHGRAAADSHLELPRVAAPRALLEADLAPFAALAAAPDGDALWAMTAHILYAALDPELPATLSPRVIGEVVRGAIGHAGVLVSDDLAMRALAGDLGTLAQQALAAGCDVALHCTGVLAETAAVLRACPPPTPAALARLDKARAVAAARRVPPAPERWRALRDAHLRAAA